ncbi:MAG: 23S rRNA (uracil(1939)-C(5))-methyltransferase RlmD [Ruminococcus sp.]|nr:23S rRNA (uracil(1939)-C(5))-methyltransferase RlmD [Ruminococcus sp.]
MSEFCPVQKKCNSCQLSNLSDSEQLHYKENKCRKLLGGMCKIMPVTPSPKTVGYRNKAQFVFRRNGKAGFVSGIWQSSNRTAVITPACAICTDKANALAAILCKLFHSFKITPYDPYTGRGWLKSVVIREATATGENMLIINGATSIFPAKRTFATALQKTCPDLTTAVIAENRSEQKLFTGKPVETLFGDGHITDVLCGKRFLISPTSFYQINRDQTENLYRKAIELMDLNGSEVVLDAYCGAGTIGIVASDNAKEVLSVELNPAAIRDAKRNAKLNNADNITFVNADSKDYAKALVEDGKTVDAAFIDPPRAGCTASFLKALARLQPQKIVYISCNPETQARDILQLGRLGYRAEVCYPYDMFPHTNHIESVCKLIYSGTKSSEKR